MELRMHSHHHLGISRRAFLSAAMAVFAALAAPLPLSAQDAGPLPSWNEGPAKQAIIDFVGRVTSQGSADFVPEPERIAVFDNDGTLWSEQPVYFQFLFAMAKAAEKAAADPAWAATPALKAAAAGDMAAVMKGGQDAMLEVVNATHSGISVEDFQAEVAAWIGKAKHPQKALLYTEMVYQPMLELLDHLRANGFSTYLVSGGGVDFMRAFAEGSYGVPPEQVIGSMGAASFQIVDGVPQVMKDSGTFFIDDKGGKPVAIARHIGRRPVLVGGNSDGDLAMLQWATAGEGPRLGLIVHHTDGTREWAYDRDSHIGRLADALDQAPAAGWIVVDMAADWKTVWPEGPR
jgi:haloacid dehalogenase-like hydrolase